MSYRECPSSTTVTLRLPRSQGVLIHSWLYRWPHQVSWNRDENYFQKKRRAASASSSGCDPGGRSQSISRISQEGPGSQAEASKTFCNTVIPFINPSHFHSIGEVKADPSPTTQPSSLPIFPSQQSNIPISHW